MSEEVTVGLLNSSKFQVYTYRWVVLAIFIFGSMANGMILPTWYSITSKADDYWDGIGITYINLLIIMFSLMGLPGTAVALRVSEYNGPRNVLICGACLTTSGCLMRVLGTIMKESIGSSGSYALVLLGTGLVGLSQPFYANMPSKIACMWFAVNERDVAMAICTITIMIAISVGAIIPPLLTSGSNIGQGIQNLMITQFSIVLGANILLVIFFRDEPPTPPSEAAKQVSQKKQLLQNQQQHQQQGKVEAVDTGRSMSATNRSFSVDLLAHKTMFSEVKSLFANPEYVKLFLSFGLSVGAIHGALSLIGQMPVNYSDSEIGYAASLVTISGLVGSFLCGFILDRTKAYRTVYKLTCILSFLSLCFFISNCQDNHYTLFMISGCLYGFLTIPTFPATICCAVECCYPIPEEATVGLLMVGSSIMSIVTTFMGQFALSLGGGHHDAPFFPFGYFILGIMLTACIPAILFNGQYLRLNQDMALKNPVGGGEGAGGQGGIDYDDRKYVAVCSADDEA